MITFIVFALGIALLAFYYMYRQIYFSVVKNNMQFAAHLVFFILFFTGMTFLGYITTNSLKSTVGFSTHWISMVIFFMLGLKVYMSVMKLKFVNWTFDTSKISTLFQFILYRTFDAFMGGLALGFYMEYPLYMFWILAGIIMLVSVIARLMAQRETATNGMWLLGMAGTLLIGLNFISVLLGWLIFM